MRFACLALTLTLSSGAFPQDGEGPPAPPPRMPADETPTHYACTLERLFRGDRCTFEFAPVPGAPSEALARENSDAAAAAARFCREAATPRDEHRADPTLRKMCEDEVARVALDGCTLEGRIPLRDAHGRVATAAGAAAPPSPVRTRPQDWRRAGPEDLGDLEMKIRLASFAVALAAACASPQRTADPLPNGPDAAATELAASGAAHQTTKQSTFNARVWVGWQDTAMDCEASARAMRQSGPQHAWEALRACIEIGRFN